MGDTQERIARLDAAMQQANMPPQNKALERMQMINAAMEREEAIRREEEIQKLNRTAMEQKPAIGQDEIRKALQIFKEYKTGKQNFDERMRVNDNWYKKNIAREPSQQGVEKAFRSSWMFNALNNKHADFMDNFPEVTVLPRARDDIETAQTLSGIMPVIYEQNRFQKTYSENCWDKGNSGTAVYGVFWDTSKLNGLGDISITAANIMNLFWKPGVQNIQDSPHFFVVSREDNDILEMMYPQLEGKLGGSSDGETTKVDTEDWIDTSKSTCVYEWYYKKTVNGKQILHYVKFCKDEILFATENQTQVRSDGNGNIIENSMASTGLYAHGKYPYVFDRLFPMKDSPVGFGYIDILKEAQEQIDILNNAILVNAKQSAMKRWIVSSNMKLNMNEFCDWTLPIVHAEEGQFNSNNVLELTTAPMSDVVIATLDRKIDELKETGSNRDFSNGSTASGVTSGAAIAALQEAGNKTSRDAIKGTYDANEEIAEMVLELIRQFYNSTRVFRITGKQNQMDFVDFNNSSMKPQPMLNDEGNVIGQRLPYFDIKIKAHKQNPFSKVAQNQDMMNLFSMGVFNPAMADQSLALLENLDIEGKDKLIQRVTENGTLLQTVQTMQPILLQLATDVDELTGSNITQTLAQQGLFGDMEIPNMSMIPQSMSAKDTNQLGEINTGSGHPTVDNAKKKVAESSELK